MYKPKGKIRRFLSFFWSSISVLRRIVGNLLFLLFVIFFIAIVFFDSGQDVPDGAALVLSPEGNIVEQHTEILRAREETLLKDVIDVIDFAKDDERIEVLVLDLRKMENAGIASAAAASKYLHLAIILTSSNTIWRPMPTSCI
jgi:protease-4